MPLYGYQCNACGHEFTEVVPVSQRNNAVESPCPNCTAEGTIIKQLSSPAIVAGVLTNITAKTPDGFKDVLREIKKRAGPGSTIDL